MSRDSRNVALREFVDSLARTRAALACPACGDTYTKPVKYLSCLHTVCGHHADKKDKWLCAVCKADVRSSGTVPDVAVQDMCEALAQLEALFKNVSGNTNSQSIKATEAKRQNILHSIATTTKPSLERNQKNIKTNAQSSKSKTQAGKLQENDTNTKPTDEAITYNKHGLDTKNFTSGKRQNSFDADAHTSKQVLDKKQDSTDMHAETTKPLTLDKTNAQTKIPVLKNSKNSEKNTLERSILATLAPKEHQDSVESDQPSKSTLGQCNVDAKAQTVKQTQRSRHDKVDTHTQRTKLAPEKRQNRLSSRTDSPKNIPIIEKKNGKGETALQVACRCLKMDKILELLEKGANPNTKDNAGWTPLHEATEKGSLEAVRLLLKHKALPGVPGGLNETPLHEAVRYNHADIATELVKHGADINAKNIKGETPLSLANDRMTTVLLSVSEDIIQSQSENIREISVVQMTSDFDDMKVHCIVPDRTVTQKLIKLAKFHDITVEEKFSNRVTHLIVAVEDDNTATASTELLQGIVNGIWILSSEWIINSTGESLENFNEYEIAGVCTGFPGPRRSRFNRYKKLPGLFNGCHFYLHNFRRDYEISKSLILSKAVLSKMITDAGGKVLKRVPNPESIPQCENTVPYHAATGGKLAKCSHYIIFTDIYEPMYNMAHLKALPIGWLLECIQKYELCDP